MSTENDRDVLNSLLNPNLPLGEGVFDPEQQAPQSLTEAGYDDQNVKKLEREAVKTAEQGDLSKALELFDEVCEGSVDHHDLLMEVITLGGIAGPTETFIIQQQSPGPETGGAT